MSAHAQPALEPMPMSERERLDLSAEAGRELSVRQAHEFRLRKLTDESITELLRERP